MASTMTGGLEVVPNASKKLEIQTLARWAVLEHNSKEKTNLTYIEVLEAKKQVVQGVKYYIVLKAGTDDGGHGKYEARIWGKDWENFLELVGFNVLLE